MKGILRLNYLKNRVEIDSSEKKPATYIWCMKSGKAIRVFTITAVSALLFHFLMTAIYSLEYIPFPRAVRDAAFTYTLPFFHQNWKMFAPSVPEYTVQLEFREKKDSTWSSWGDASQSCGFDRRSRVEYMEQTISGALSWQVANNMYAVNKVRQLDRVMESYDYHRALYFIYSLKNRTGQQVGDSAQIRLSYRFTPKPNMAANDQLSYLEFPTYYALP